MRRATRLLLREGRLAARRAAERSRGGREATSAARQAAERREERPSAAARQAADRPAAGSTAATWLAGAHGGGCEAARQRNEGAQRASEAK
jgi:hypothetical protein